MGKSIFIGKAVIGDRKLIKGSLAEFLKCARCLKEFWAESEWEEGNFVSYCRVCKSINEKEIEKEDKEMKLIAKEKAEKNRVLFKIYWKKLRTELKESVIYTFQDFLEETRRKNDST